MTPQTIHPLCVFTSQTRRYSDLFGLLRQHTPMKSRNGCTSSRIFRPPLSSATITSLHPRSFLPASPVLHWECTSPRCTQSQESPSLNSASTRLRSPLSLKWLSRLTPSRTVSPLDFSATHGPGATSSLAPHYWSPLSPEYRHPVSFKLNARGTPAKLFALTLPSGKIPPSTMLPKCSTSRHFPKEPAATTKNFFTNVTGPSGTTSARVPVPTRAGPNF